MRLPETAAVAEVAQSTGLPARRVAAGVRVLRFERDAALANDRVSLTDKGRHRAIELIRAHRLWESYLVDEAGVDTDAIHDEAERLEHAHILADEVDRTLGHPARDPHGTIIPSTGTP